MIFTTVIFLAFLCASGLAVPTRWLVRRGPMPMEIYETMSPKGQLIVKKIFNVVNIKGQSGQATAAYANLLVDVPELRAVVEISRSEHEDASAAQKILQWFEESIAEFEKDAPGFDSTVKRARETLEMVKEEPLYPESVKAGEREARKKIQTAVGAAAAALGLGGVAIGGTYAVKSQQERSVVYRHVDDSRHILNELD